MLHKRTAINRLETFDLTVELSEMVFDDLATVDVDVDEKKWKKWTTPAKRYVLN